MIKIIFIVIGTFVGAGFASGKEVMLFFFQHGYLGIIGIITSSCFIGVVLYKTIRICQNEHIDKYDQFVNHIFKYNLTKILIKKWISFFLLISFSVMISGFCSFSKQEFFIEKYVSFFIIILICIYAFNKKIDTVMYLSNILVPIIIFFVVYFTLKNFTTNIDTSKLFDTKNNYFFIIHAILYCNYNLLSIIPITIMVSSAICQKKQAFYLSILCAIIILILSCCIFFLLNNLSVQDLNLDFPIVRATEVSKKSYKNIYCMIIAFSIVTTAISVGYTYIENKKSKLIWLFFFSFIAIQFPFSQLLEFLYPICGLIGFLQSYYIIKK